jgi:hypothetical protein
MQVIFSKALFDLGVGWTHFLQNTTNISKEGVWL